MNPRILEFARQTGLCDADGDFFGGKISQYDEFAELIVRECARLNFKATGEVTTDGEITVSNLILEHFGVER